MTISTVSIVALQSTGQALPNGRVTLQLTGLDIVGGLVAPEPVTVLLDASGMGSCSLIANASGTQGTQYRVTFFDQNGQFQWGGLATIPATATCNLHDVLNLTPAPALSDAMAAQIAAQGYAAQAGAVLTDPAFVAVHGDLANIDAVAADLTPINTVAADVANVNAVAGISGNVTTVAGIAANVTTVAGISANVTTVSGIAGNVTTVAGIAANVTAVAGDLANIDTVATDLTNVDTVATNISAVNTAATNIVSIQGATAAAASASASASSALAIYGDTATMNAAVASSAANAGTATAQAGLAQTYAASASSVVQQDLSAVVGAALHRSPNAIVAQTIYDVSKDSDGGAWVDRVTNTSWFNEALNGTWLVPTDPRGWQSELDARSSGATLGAEMVTNGTFTNGTTGWTSPYASVLTVPRANTLRATTGAGQTLNYATQSFSVTAGNTYVATATPVAKVTAAGAPCDFRVGTSSQGSEYGRNSSIPPGQTARIVFTATATGTIYLGLVADNGGVAGDYAEWQNISVKPITALNTASGAYYQLATDGKFYRLWKNLLKNSNALTAAGWGFTNASGTATQVGNTLTFGASAVDRIVGNGIGSINAGVQLTGSALLSGSGNVRLLGFDGAGSTGGTTNIALTSTPTWYSVSYVAAAGGASAGIGIYNNAGGIAGASVTVGDTMLEYGTASTASTAQETKGADGSQTETFRGNTAKFPRLSAIVAEATNVTIYDLTKPGCPMWMRFTTAATQLLNANITSVAMLNGSLRVGSSVSGLAIFEFISDNKWGVRADTNKYRVGSMANRNAATDPNFVGYFSANTLVNTVVNAVAMTVLPDAPLDPFTGLQVPTIAVATAGGVSVIKHDGSVVNSSQTASTLDCHIQGYMLYLSNQLTITGYARYQDLRTIAAKWTPTSFPAYIINTPAVASEVVSMPLANGVIAHRQNAGGLYGVDLTQLNPANPASSLKAYLAPYYNTGWMTGDIRRCWLSSNVAESITATELVNAGNMSNPAAWTFGTIGTVTSASVSGGVMSLPRTDAANYSYAWQIVPTVIGKVYTLNVTAGATSILGKVSATTFNSAGIGAPVFAANTTTPYTFVATSATTYITLLSNIDATTATVTLVSVTEVIADRSYKNKPLTINGTLAKTLTGGLAMYGGWSATNYAQEAYSADLDPGTAGFYVPITSTIPVGVAAAGWAFDRSAAAGASYKAGHDATGHLTASVFDGTTTRTVTTTAAYNTGTVFSWAVGLSPSGTLTIYVGGKAVATATGAPLLTLTNASATCTVGIDRGLTAPWSGSLALVKPGMTNPTAEQATFAYEQEKFLWMSGAACTLPDSGAVVDMDYDASMDRLKVVSAANESNWTGLARTASAAVSAGAFIKASHRSGVKLLARSTTNPGVDVSIPAYGLREELFNRAEAAARLSRLMQCFEFDAVTGQTDFALPVGYTAVEVLSNRARQREGSTKDWTRLFDGFVETTRFAVAPGNGVWVHIDARRAA
jgi:trimeric autotransporter adhesin